MFRVYHSNSMESLAERLVELADSALQPPLQSECIVTQNKGMARWLSQALAHEMGIVANVEFAYPASFIWRVFQSQWPQLKSQSGYERQVLIWRCMQQLPEALEDEVFQSLRHYLDGPREPLKRYQLSRRIADLFDQYTIYRPAMIQAWERGEAEEASPWQARLWRSLVAGNEPGHRANLLKRFAGRVNKGELERGPLPERVFLFGVAGLPPAYLQVLSAISSCMDVHLFLMNPSVAYWGDIRSEKQLAQLRERYRAQPAQANLLLEHVQTGNPLLASLGKQGQDYLELLQQLPHEDEMLYRSPGDERLLNILQADILLLQRRGREQDVAEAARLPIAVGDTSIQLHSCHSAMRELEILHDQLLHLFATMEGLQPDHILVMLPDVDPYVPFIEAVFGSAPKERYIPWAIADASPQSEHPIIQLFLELLHVPQGRFALSEVLSILEVPAVLRRFEMDYSDFETLRDWCMDSGIRWGLNAEQRGAEGEVMGDYASWRFGLKRMLLGYAMPADYDQPYHDILPFNAIEGADARLLGSLLAFMEALERWHDFMLQAHNPHEWLLGINAMLESFVQVQGDEEPALQLIRDTLDALQQETTAAGYEQTIGHEVLLDYLQGHLREISGWQRFFTGDVTFSSMIPMRSIPHRVICLVGMNERDFPRRDSHSGFDLMANQPQAGDRSRRDDDRYLFLEALLCARERLYISYVGRDVRDNSVRNPSVLINELMDTLEEGFSATDGSSLTAQITTTHPLQPFSARYFGAEEGLFSYASQWLPAGRENHGEAAQSVKPQEKSVVQPVVELAHLLRFFRDPAEYYYQQVLGARLPADEPSPQDSEVFTLGGLESYQLEYEMLQALCEGHEDVHSILLRYQGAALLPFGPFAEQEGTDKEERVRRFAAEILPLLQAEPDFAAVDLDLADTHLSGNILNIHHNRLLRYRPSPIKLKDQLRLWLEHLAFNAVHGDAGSLCLGFNKKTGKTEQWSLPPMPQARELLQELLKIYQQGLQKPLPLFPELAHKYLELLQDNSEEAAIAKVRTMWHKEEAYNQQALKLSTYHQILFQDDDAFFNGEFQQLARALWLPLLQAAENSGEGA